MEVESQLEVAGFPEDRLTALEGRLTAIERSDPVVAEEQLSSLDAQVQDLRTALRLDPTQLVELSRLRDEVDNVTATLLGIQDELDEDLTVLSGSMLTSDERLNDRIGDVDNRFSTILVILTTGTLGIAGLIVSGFLILGRRQPGSS